MENWRVEFGCPEWKDKEENLPEQAARRRYEQHCKNPEMRGGKRARYVSLFEGNSYRAGWASTGKYGKV